MTSLPGSANDSDWSDCAKEDWDRQPDDRAGDLAAAARVLTRRPLPGRLRYLAEELRRGADPVVVSIALDVTATELTAGRREMTDAELRGWAADQPFPDLLHMPGADAARCAICGQSWPCPTRREEDDV